MSNEEDLENLPESVSTKVCKLYIADCIGSWLTTVQLFVKNIPLNRSLEELKGMFSQFGKVQGVVPVAARRNVVYVVSHGR